MIYLPTKLEVLVFASYGDMKGVAKCRKWGGLGWLGVTEGRWQCHQSMERVRLPIRFNRNCAYGILCRFPDGNSPTSAYPTFIWRHRLGVTPCEFHKDLWLQKTRVPELCVRPFASSYLAVSVEHPTCDTHRHRQAQGHGIYRAKQSSRGKK